MTSPLTVYKLIILYLLEKAQCEIALERVSSFLLDRGYAGFLALVKAYAELEESGLVSSRLQGERVLIRISEEGERALSFFEGELGSEIRSDCDAWLRESRIALLEEQAADGSISFLENGKYEVTLTLRDRQAPLMELRLRVPDRDTAGRILAQWQEENAGIYRFIIEKLS